MRKGPALLRDFSFLPGPDGADHPPRQGTKSGLTEVFLPTRTENLQKISDFYRRIVLLDV
jgi:hypothetical protein